MWRRSHFRIDQGGFGSQRLLIRRILISSVFVLCLGALAAFSQDTTPPPPLPDAQSPAPDPVQSSVRAVRLSDVEGQVQVFQGDQLAFDQAEPNMPAVEGMRLVTGNNGRVEVEFEDGSVARVTPNSSIRLSQLQRNPDGSTTTQIDALTGLSYYELNGRAGQVSVHWSADTAAPQDSAVFRIALDSAPNELAVMHGEVHVSNTQGYSADVHPNQTVQTDPQQPGDFSIAQSVSADSWDQWNSDRDQALAELESNETTARASSGSPDDAAWNDLDYYGSWYNLPGYGQVWSPNGVDSSWDPFGSGSWGYYPSFGYTWISSYPWGWWPYHCGAWDFLDSWGWIWVPGNCGWGFYGAGWFPYATVWRVPHGYFPPSRPHQGPGNGHGPRPAPVIAVNRGPQFSAPFHEHGPRPEPRPLSFGGQTLTPLRAEIHPIQRGPVGESFTSTLVREHPEMVPPAVRAQQGTPGYRTPYTPGIRTFGATPGYSTPHYGEPTSTRNTWSSHPSTTSPPPHPGGGGGGASAPHPSGGASTPHH